MPSSVLAKNVKSGTKSKNAGGITTVGWVDARGKTLAARVTGGTYPNLNLYVPALPQGSRVKTAIAKRTAMTDTNVWYSYL